MNIKFGPAGLGGVKEAEGNLEEFSRLGLKACEISFTYGVYIKNKEDAVKIGEKAKGLGISLSIHAPYWINLNSLEKEKVMKSKERILSCCEVGSWLGASRIVFHPGYYGKMEKEETYQNIMKEVLDLVEVVKKNKWNVELAPETTGKVNVFGSVDEIVRLVKDTGCGFCIDFSHILAREKEIKYKEILEKFGGEKLHIHFSGIEYGEKGEKRHLRVDKKLLKELIESLKKYAKDRDVVVISESPQPVLDSVLGLKLF